MGATTSSTADWLVKKLYRDGLDEEALVSANKLMAHVSRDRKFATAGGSTSTKGMDIPVPGSNGNGLGVSHADAYLSRSGATGKVFTVPQRRLYHFGELASDVVRNTEAAGDEAQFVNILTRDIDGATENFGQELNQRLYGTSLGERARVHATTAISGAVLTLANPEDAAFFEIDMLVQLVNPASLGAPRDSGDYVKIIAKDDIAGTLTADSAWATTITGATTGDIIIRRGTLGASLDGLQGWCPETPSTDFLGVNQTDNRTRFAGVFADVSTYAIRPGLLRYRAVAESQMGMGFKAKAPIFMHPSDQMEIIASVEAVKVVETSVKTDYNIGLEAVEVLGHTIVADRHCPIGRAFQVQKEAFTLGSCGNQPNIDDIDGKKFHYSRQTGTLEFVLAFDGNSYSKRVNALGHIKLPTRVS